MKRETMFRYVLVIVLLVVMCFLTVDYHEHKVSQRISDGNRILLCESIRARLDAEAAGDTKLQNVYDRRCR